MPRVELMSNMYLIKTSNSTNSLLASEARNYLGKIYIGNFTHACLNLSVSHATVNLQEIS